MIFRPKSEIQRFFPSKIRWSPKKKKKKKKKVFAKIQSDFSPKFRKFKRLRGGSFRVGGAIFHFSQKIGLKSTKYMRFCILHKPMGGARAPPAPPWLRYCTLLSSHHTYNRRQRRVYDDLVAWSGFNSQTGHVVAFLDKTLYDDYLCLMVTNKQRILWDKNSKEPTGTLDRGNS